METDDYVHKIAAKFRGNEVYTLVGRQRHAHPRAAVPPGQRRVRAAALAGWRTWGISGGMVPWEFDRLAYDKPQFYKPASDNYIALGPRAVPGIWPDTVAEGDLVPWTVSADPQARSGRRVLAGGPGDERGERTRLGLDRRSGPGPLRCKPRLLRRPDAPSRHHRHLRRRCPRQQATRRPLDGHARRYTDHPWSGAFDRPAGRRRALPVAVDLPDVRAKQQGRIELQLDAKVVDVYPFTVFPSRRPQAAGTFRLYDPKGLTAAMLKKRGVPFIAWDGTFAAGDVLLIGRQALSQGKALDLDLAKAMQQGLRAVLFPQDVDFWETRMRWRTSWHVSRKFFRTGGADLAGLSDDDLANWRSRGTLIGERDAFPSQVADTYPPPAPIWHWGNANAVASVALEKPHYGNFTPLLEGEFDLAFSPLLDLRDGRGLLVICQLNLEENVGMDGAADAALDGCWTWSDARCRRRNWLSSTGPTLVNAANISQHGGNVLVTGCKSERELRAAAAELQLKLETKTARLRGSTSLPSWPELRGVSVSDLHWRGFLDVPVVTSVHGGEIGADGLLAKVAVGRGTVLFCQAHPDMFPVDAERTELQRPDFPPPSGQSASKTYFRLSRWRTRRLLSQLANNLGPAPVPRTKRSSRP